MPARWVTLIDRVQLAIDKADDDLGYADRLMFFDQLQRILIRRRPQRRPITLDHPPPSPGSPAIRDVTGDLEDLGA
jgi:hypothetical protein